MTYFKISRDSIADILPPVSRIAAETSFDVIPTTLQPGEGSLDWYRFLARVRCCVEATYRTLGLYARFLARIVGSRPSMDYLTSTRAQALHPEGSHVRTTERYDAAGEIVHPFSVYQLERWQAKQVRHLPFWRFPILKSCLRCLGVQRLSVTEHLKRKLGDLLVVTTAMSAVAHTLMRQVFLKREESISLEDLRECVKQKLKNADIEGLDYEQQSKLLTRALVEADEFFDYYHMKILGGK